MMMLTLMQEVSTRDVSRNLVEQLVSYSVLHSVDPEPEQFFTRGLKIDLNETASLLQNLLNSYL